MKPIVTLTLPIVLLAAAGTTPAAGGARAPEPGPAQSSVHVNRHVDAHVPAREGETTKGVEEPVRRRPAQDPFRSVIQPPVPVTPTPAQPLRDRRY